MYQQKIDLLKTSGAPQSQIDSAISEKNIAISSTKQEILTQTALAEANVAGKLVDFPKALELRNKMVNESSNAINELKKTDPNAATVLQKKAVEDLEKIDAAAAYRANCNTYGKTFNTFTYKCTN
jgi:alpha-N-acetylglucosamine transferase